MEINENSTIRDLLRLLDVKIEDAAIVIVNGKSSTYKQMVLEEGAGSALIPPLAEGEN